jgi:hypothetical protein
MKRRAKFTFYDWAPASQWFAELWLDVIGATASMPPWDGMLRAIEETGMVEVDRAVPGPTPDVRAKVWTYRTELTEFARAYHAQTILSAE